jgi:hypothetical protein
MADACSTEDFANIRKAFQEEKIVFTEGVVDPPPLKWSDLNYVFDMKEDCNAEEAIHA